MRKPADGAIGVACPSCGVRPIERAASLWYLRGFLLVARYGSTLVVGCRDCVQRASRRQALVNLLLGWWTFPWGVATPVVVLQNLLARPSAQLVRQAAARAGIHYDDVLLDVNGMTGEGRRALWAYANVAHQVAAAGQRETVIRAAASVLADITAHRITEASAAQTVREGATYPLPLAQLDGDDRRRLLAFAVMLASLGGPPTPAAWGTLCGLARQLGVPADVLDELLRDEPVADDTELSRARRVLGVDAGADMAEIRARYKALLVELHPDRAVVNGMSTDEATRRTQQVTAAYEVVRAAQLQPTH